MRKQIKLIKSFLYFTLVGLSLQVDTLCVIQNNQLSVPETGCTLQKQSDEIIVDTITLNGELIMKERNTLKYKKLDIKNKAALTIISNFERIVFEDISDSSCDPSQQNKMIVNFSSKSKNQWFDIEYVEDYSIKLINKKSTLLNIGHQIFLVSDDKFIKASITDIQGDIIKIDQKCIKKQGFPIEVNDQLILYDDNRPTFIKQFHYINLFIKNIINHSKFIKIKSNCLNIDQTQSSQQLSNGAIFLDLKGMYYSTQLTDDKLNLKDIIIMQSEGIQRNGITSISANIQDGIFINHTPTLSLKAQMPYSNIAFINSGNIIADNSINVSTIFNRIFLYQSQSSFTLKQKADSKLIIDDFMFLSSKISFEFENDTIDSLTLQNGVITSKSIDIVNNINAIYYKNVLFFQKAFINTSNYSSSEIGLFECLIDGKDLEGVIQVKDNQFQKLLVNQVQFINFASSPRPLIYSLTQSGLFNNQIQTPGENRINYEVYIFECIFSFDTTKVKLIDLPKLKLYYNDQTLVFPHQVINLDYNFYQMKNLVRTQNTFISDQYLFYLPSTERLSLIQFNISFGQELYDIKVEMQDGITTIDFNKPFYLIDSFDYNIYVNLKPNKQNSHNNLQLKILTNYGQQSFYSKVRIFHDPSQPVKSMQVDNSDLASLNSLDNSIILSPNDTEEQTIVLNLTLCQFGQVFENNQCKSVCTDLTIAPLKGICFNKSQQSFPKYFLSQDGQNKSILQSCPWYCSECTDQSTCTACDKNTTPICDDLQYKQALSSSSSIITCQSNCLSCLETQCLVCDFQMGISSDGNCKLPESNQYITKGIIQDCPIYCKQCLTEQHCSLCQDGYQLQFGQCVKKCQLGEFYFQGECHACQETEVNCENLFNRQCIDEYEFKNASFQCEVSLIPNPKICDGSNCYPCFKQTDKSCSNPYPPLCDAGKYYSYQDKQCYKCHQNCEECNIDAIHCTACNSASILNDKTNKCEQCPDNYIPINNTCTKCPSGSFSISGHPQCQQCHPSCTECSGNSKYCLSCSSTYYLKDNQCLQCDDNCKSCTSNLMCIECVSEDYQLENNKCVGKILESESEMSEEKIIGIVLGVVFSSLFVSWAAVKSIRYVKFQSKKVKISETQLNAITKQNSNFIQQETSNNEVCETNKIINSV